MARRRRTIAVMGAGGYIGRNLQRMVYSSRLDIEIVPVPRAYYELDAIENMVDGLKPFDASDPIHDASALICLAGAGTQSARQPYEDSIGHTAIAASLLCRTVNIPRLVYMSGLGASYHTPIAYLSAKYRAELAIRDFGRFNVIFRPSYIVGHGDHLVDYVEQHAQRTPAPIDIYDSNGFIQPIHIDDAVNLILWGAFDAPESVILDMVGPDRVPFCDYMAVLAKEAGLPVNKITLEEAYRHALGDPFSAAFGVDELGVITGGFVGDFSELVRTTGIEPRRVAIPVRT